MPPEAEVAVAVDTALTAAPAAPVETAAPAPAPAAEGQSSETSQGIPSTETTEGAATEKPADAGAPAEGEQPAGEKVEVAPGAPEAGYADFSLPEGIELAGDMLDSLTTVAKAHNMNQEQAQALVDLGVKQANEIAERFTNLTLEKPVPASAQWAAVWSEQTVKDAELGKDLKGTMAVASSVFQKFATPELGEFLAESGLAHHPELIRFMTKIGAVLSEDTLVTAQGGRQGKETGLSPFSKAASRLYANMN